MKLQNAFDRSRVIDTFMIREKERLKCLNPNMQIRRKIKTMKLNANVIRAFGLMSLSGLMTFAALPVLGADRVKAGQYDITTVADGKTVTSSICISVDEAKAFNADATAGRALYEKEIRKAGCAVKTYDVSGNKVSTSIVCEGSVAMSTNNTYAGDSYEGDLTRTVRGTTFVAHSKGKRTGVCKSE